MNASVLVVTPDFPPSRGGIQVLTHRVVCGWDDVDPTVVTLDAPGAGEFDRRQGFPIIRVPTLPALRPATISALNATTVLVASRRRPQAVFSSHIVAAPSAAFVARHVGVPYVQYVHAKELGAKPDLARFALTRADAVIAVSDYTRGLARGAGAPEDRIELINPGVDLPAVSGEAVDRRPGPPTILSIARLEDRYKGHDVMMRAFPLIRSRVPDARWVIIGDGPLRSTLERRARAYGIADSVRFLGPVDDAERDDWLDRSHVFCMVSRLPAGRYAGEGFGIVYLEANAHGLPVVAGNVGGALDAVVHEETGFLVDPTDPVEVAEAHVRALQDSSLAARLGEQGRRRASGFDWPLVSQRVQRLLLDLTAGSPSMRGTERAPRAEPVRS